MKKLVGCLCLIAVASIALCAKDAKKPGAEDARVKQIWGYVENRLTDQYDIWFKIGDWPATINVLRFLNAEDPTDYDYATNLGWMLENIHQNDEALAVYVRYRRENTKDPDGALPLADFYFRNKAYSKIPPLLQSRIAMKPHPNCYRILAHSYEKLGLLPDATKVWKQLVSDHPEDDAAKLNLKKDETKLASQKSAS